jgi:hypothetical protein
MPKEIEADPEVALERDLVADEFCRFFRHQAAPSHAVVGLAISGFHLRGIGLMSRMAIMATSRQRATARSGENAP